MAAPLRLTQERIGDTIAVSGAGMLARFTGAGLAPRGAHVALWFGLPVAMRLGQDLHIMGAVCPGALANARRLVAIWSEVLPDLFDPIAVTAQAELPLTTPAAGPRLMTFSGGIDSTMALRDLHRATGERPTLLTIQGMDYRLGDDARFARLLERTLPLREAIGCAQTTLASDAATTYRAVGVPIVYGFGFQLAACLFSFEDSHSGGLISADIAHHRECVDGVYGTSSATTPLLSSAGFRIALIGLEDSRMSKIARLADDPLALASVSFCKDYATRPENCGVCAKCVRTKGHFLAATGTIPDIFLKPGLAPEDFAAVDLRQSFYAETWARMIAHAEAQGRGADFAPLKRRLAAKRHPGRLRWLWYRLRVMRRAAALRRGRGA